MPVDLCLRPHFAWRIDELGLDLDIGVPVGTDDVGLLEHRLGGQDDVGLACGVGQELVNHDPEVEGAKGLEHLRCLGVLGHRVTAFDPRHLELGVSLLEHLRTETRGRDRNPDRIVIGRGWIERERLADRAENAGSGGWRRSNRRPVCRYCR